MSDHQNRTLDIPLEQALVEGQIQGIVLACYQNEKPLHGISGLMDWYLHGALSYHIKKGNITGKVGECVYLPFTKHQKTFHFLIGGCGYSTEPGSRIQFPQETLTILKKNLVSLKLERMGVSKSDFGHVSDSYFYELFEGINLWIGA